MTKHLNKSSGDQVDSNPRLQWPESRHFSSLMPRYFHRIKSKRLSYCRACHTIPPSLKLVVSLCIIMTHIHSGVVCGADLSDVLSDTISPRHTVSIGIVTKRILCVVEPSSDFINTSASKCHSEPHISHLQKTSGARW